MSHALNVVLQEEDQTSNRMSSHSSYMVAPKGVRYDYTT